jgi:RHS repeat-associated protein
LITSIASAGAAPGSVTYAYNANLQVSGATVPGSAAVAYGYDSDGVLTSAGALSLTRHASNATLSSTSLAQVSSSHVYNGFAEPTADTFKYGTTNLYDASYTRDALGRIATRTETVDGTTRNYVYTYDARGRLTDVTRDGSAWRHYDYDSNGNRTGATEGATSLTGDYDGQDRVLSYGSATFEHNAMGQRVSKTVGSDTTTYTYDELGTLVSVGLAAKTVSYVVDGLNRRVARKVDGAVTNRYLYGQGILPVAELNADGSVKSRFVFASKAHVPDYMVKGGVTYRFVTDQVGSVRLVVNTSDGTVAQRIDYDPFGKVTSDTNPGFQPFGFAGGLYDQDTGLVRFGARDYDAETGRWTAKDPIGFEGGDTNLYGYVGGDPVNFVDPTGEFAFLPFVAAAYAIFEVASTLYDIYDTASTLLDGCASGGDKAAAIFFLALGGVLPGGGYSKADDVIEETLSRTGSFTSKHVLSADEALEAGQRWVGEGYKELGNGVYRGANGRQFRIDDGSLQGAHKPRVPHVHLEAFRPGDKYPYVNNHVGFYE